MKYIILVLWTFSLFLLMFSSFPFRVECRPTRAGPGPPRQGQLQTPGHQLALLSSSTNTANSYFPHNPNPSTSCPVLEGPLNPWSDLYKIDITAKVWETAIVLEGTARSRSEVRPDGTFGVTFDLHRVVKGDAPLLRRRKQFRLQFLDNPNPHPERERDRDFLSGPNPNRNNRNKNNNNNNIYKNSTISSQQLKSRVILSGSSSSNSNFNLNSHSNSRSGSSSTISNSNLSTKQLHQPQNQLQLYQQQQQSRQAFSTSTSNSRQIQFQQNQRQFQLQQQLSRPPLPPPQPNYPYPSYPNNPSVRVVRNVTAASSISSQIRPYSSTGLSGRRSRSGRNVPHNSFGGRAVSLSAKCLPPKATVKTGRKYYVFAAKVDNHFIAVFSPELANKRNTKAVEGILCKGCGQAPSVVVAAKDVQLKVKERLRLRCRLRAGNPIPLLTWTKDGRPVNFTDTRFRLRTKRRQSILVIRKAKEIDAGVYRCEGKNAFGSAHASVRVTVPPSTPSGSTFPSASKPSTHLQSSSNSKKPLSNRPSSSKPVGTTPTTLWPLESRECPYDSYCLNGGTCSYYETIGEFVCQCSEGYKGQRCDTKDIPNSGNHRGEYESRRHLMLWD